VVVFRRRDRDAFFFFLECWTALTDPVELREARVVLLEVEENDVEAAGVWNMIGFVRIGWIDWLLVGYGAVCVYLYYFLCLVSCV
jgi:hypothetical protein